MKFNIDKDNCSFFDNEKQLIGKCNIIINHHIVDEKSYDKYILDMIYLDENLKYMFAKKDLIDEEKLNMLSRFIPEKHHGKKISKEELKKHINEHLNIENKEKRKGKNLSFYSFFSEGLMGLVFKDIFKFEVAKGLIDINQTLKGVEQGADGCFFNLEEKLFILGEAKFYKSYNSGIKKIMDNFSNKIENKLMNFSNMVRINVLDLSSEELISYNVEDFLGNNNINFAGFVLHESQKTYNYSIEKYTKIEEIKKNVIKELGHDINLKQVYYIHLPVSNKLDIVLNLILKADEERSKILGNGRIYV